MTDMQDSGQRRAFNSGAVRDRCAGKPRPDLISPIFLMRVGTVLGKAADPIAAGGKGYGERNWEKGIPVGESFASLCRHINQWCLRQTDEDHLAHAACNLMFILHTLDMIDRGLLPAALDNMPHYQPRQPTGETHGEVLDSVEP